MNQRLMIVLALLAAVFASSEAHKKFYNGGVGYGHSSPERCVCDCSNPSYQPVLPSKPYYGNAGYAQPRPNPGGYGNSGAYAVAGSYGAGQGQVTGGY